MCLCFFFTDFKRSPQYQYLAGTLCADSSGPSELMIVNKGDINSSVSLSSGATDETIVQEIKPEEATLIALPISKNINPQGEYFSVYSQDENQSFYQMMSTES